MFSKTPAYGNSKNEKRKETEEVGKVRRANMERTAVGKEKKISLNGLTVARDELPKEPNLHL